MDFNKNYYSILGVSRDSSKEELKAAYRRLALKYHPDRSKTDDPRIMQEVNQAYEILNDSERRSLFDSFHIKAEELKGQEDKAGTAATYHMRTYERKYMVTEIEKLYLRGRITVKFWASLLETTAMEAADYKLNPVETIITILQENVDVRTASPQFQDAVHQSEIFRSPILQPVCCEIRNDDGMVRYDLTLNDIRIAKVELIDINKYDEQSLGTLVGDVFAEVVSPKTHEESEWVTECSGATGRVEQKQEEGWNWQRMEYYHIDCTTYWTKWEKLSEIPPSKSDNVETNPVHPSTDSFQWKNWKGSNKIYRNIRERIDTRTNLISGDKPLWPVLLLLILMIIAVPQLFLPVIFYIILFIFLNLGARIAIKLKRLVVFTIALIGLGLIGVAMHSAVGNESHLNLSRPRAGDSKVVTTKKTVNRGRTSRSRPHSADTLITHAIQWTDYDSTLYIANLSLQLSSLKNSIDYHEHLVPENFSAIAAVYNSLDQHDAPDLDMLYNSFDSIRSAAVLDELQFANMVVSCVQSIPYYLIVDKTCSASLYTDEFTRNYLKNCNEECCLGDVSFGVRAPLEFLSDLKGDCDTRALFLYTVLRHFNYNVALIVSEYYKHAAIAVGFTKELENAASVIRRGTKNLYTWETTGKNFKAGNLPSTVNDLKYWQIALINE